MFFVALIIGCLIGVGISLLIVGTLLDNSNNKGDSKGEYRDFIDIPLTVYDRADRVRRPN